MERQTQLTPGATVYGAEGDKVGTLQTYGANYIVVEKGFFFPTDYYIPVSAINTFNEEEVFLSVTKDEALDRGWDIEPTDNVATAPHIGTEYEYAGAQTGQYVDDETVRVPVHEEYLEATKRAVEAGDVTLSKRVVTEQETIEVPVTEERVQVEWRAPTGEVTAEGEVFEEGTIEIPVSREEVDISKRTVQTGEVEVTKQREQRTQKVTDSVRREVVDVDDSTAEAQRGGRSR
jgi:uncharacterized protein (TIGR02271 family)